MKLLLLIIFIIEYITVKAMNIPSEAQKSYLECLKLKKLFENLECEKVLSQYTQKTNFFEEAMNKVQSIEILIKTQEDTFTKLKKEVNSLKSFLNQNETKNMNKDNKVTQGKLMNFQEITKNTRDNRDNKDNVNWTDSVNNISSFLQNKEEVKLEEPQSKNVPNASPNISTEKIDMIKKLYSFLESNKAQSPQPQPQATKSTEPINLKQSNETKNLLNELEVSLDSLKTMNF